MLRRVLLGALVALLVARPAAVGEDPGKLLLVDATSGLVLGLGWFLLGLVAAVGRLRYRAGDWGGYTTAALLGVVALLFAGASFAASYRHPAYLAAWDATTVLVAFVLVRQLATEPAEGGKLTAVLLATAVSLAVPALYASIAAALHGPTLQLAAAPIVLEQQGLPETLRHELLPLAINEPGARGLLERPDTFAGWLILLLPAAGAVLAVAWRAQALQREAALVVAVVLAVALVLTRQVTAVVALLIVVAVLGVRSRGELKARPRLGLILTAVGLALLGLTVLHRYGPSGPTTERVSADLRDRGAAMTAAFETFRERPVLGVGPANVSRYMARHTPADAAEVSSEAGSAPLQVAAAGGALGLVALAAVLVLFVRQLRRGGEESAPVETGRRTEFTIGGAVGLLGEFLLRAIDVPATEPPPVILQLGLADAIRAGVWFAAFAFFDALIGRRAAPRRALLVGAAAVLVFGLVSGAPLLPALATPLAVVAALALPRPPRPAGEAPAGPWLERTIPVTAAVVLALGFVVQAAAPGVQAGPDLKSARRTARVYLDQDYRRGRSGTAGGRLNALNHIEGTILPALRSAERADPGDAALALELAEWLREHTRLGGAADWHTALRAAQRARFLDPQGVGGLWEELEIRLARGPELGLLGEFFEDQNKLIDELTARDPSAEARLHDRLAEKLADYREAARQRVQRLNANRASLVKPAEKRPELLTNHDAQIHQQEELARQFGEQLRIHSQRAIELDDAAPGPRPRLDPFRREMLREWLRRSG